MMSPLQEQLVATPGNGLLDLNPIGIHVCDIGFRVTRYAVEVAEFAVGNADIGGVDIAVDLPGYFSMGHLDLPHFIRHMHQFGEGGFLEKKKTLFRAQVFKIQCLLVQIVKLTHGLL